MDNTKESKMGFFDGLGKKVVDAGQKTKGMSDVVCINYLIAQEENKINNMYYKIGKLYASIHSNDCEEEFLEMINTIAELEQNIWNYRDQIQNIKGVQCCEKCGADIPKGVYSVVLAEPPFRRQRHKLLMIIISVPTVVMLSRKVDRKNENCVFYSNKSIF